MRWEKKSPRDYESTSTMLAETSIGPSVDDIGVDAVEFGLFEDELNVDMHGALEIGVPPDVDGAHGEDGVLPKAAMTSQSR
jgi:hypothetical protein